ncbi:MAG: DUF4293 domain-containing protein [Flavobacteriales bacterium]|nr:DUF4293 domain-containing protein [Flavobacteriales bacterium]
MLQRVQSLFLALAALAAIATWWFPVMAYSAGGGGYVFRTAGLLGPAGEPVEEAAFRLPFQWVLTALAAVLLVTIFLYGDRKRQLRVLRGSYLLTLLVIAFLFITDRSLRGWLGTMGPVEAHFGIAFFLPFATLLLTFLAERAIRRDEELVRSADRLR